MHPYRASKFCLCLFLFALGQAHAQDLEPRRWTPLPPGLNVIGAGYVVSDGDVFFDPALQIENASVEADSVAVSYVHSFSLAGKLARFDLVVPWQHVRWDGLLSGQPASATRVGLADPTFRLSVILAGASPDPTAKSNTVVGAAIAVTAPLGEYQEDKLLNLGQNRYVFRPQIGVVHTRGQWSYELTGSGLFYTDNDEFFGGITREQDPLYAVQGHVIHSFKKPGYWAALSAGYGGNGQSIINGNRADDDKRLFLSALSIGMPLGNKQGLKFAYIRSRTNTNKGSDTDSLAVGWSFRF
jgi:hypothetical protein